MRGHKNIKGSDRSETSVHYLLCDQTVNLYSCFSGKLHIVTEFCSGGSLQNLLIKSRINPLEDSPDYKNMASTLNHRELLKLAVDVANGMAHLSSQNVSSAEDET